MPRGLFTPASIMRLACSLSLRVSLSSRRAASTSFRLSAIHFRMARRSYLAVRGEYRILEEAAGDGAQAITL